MVNFLSRAVSNSKTKKISKKSPFFLFQDIICENKKPTIKLIFDQDKQKMFM